MKDDLALILLRMWQEADAAQQPAKAEAPVPLKVPRKSASDPLPMWPIWLIAVLIVLWGVLEVVSLITRGAP